jgi:hypothetical protein
LHNLQIALRLCWETTMTLTWIAQRLHMGTKTHLSHLLHWRSCRGCSTKNRDLFPNMQIQRVIELCVGLAFAAADVAHSADLPKNVKTKSYTQNQNDVYLHANLPLRCRKGDLIPLEIELKNSSSHDIT